MAGVTWGQLAKSLSDAQTIITYIANQFATHNADESAHGQSSEAIYNHRVAEILDHLDQSVKNQHIKAEHRAYNAIVDAAGGADFTDIQDALDFVATLGGGRVLIMPGTYTLAADLVMPADTVLEGLVPADTILDFNSTTYMLTVPGTGLAPLPNVSIKSLTIKNSKNTTYGAIKAVYADNITIQDCIFTDNYDVGGSAGKDIYLNGCNFALVQRNLTSGGGSFIYATAGWGVKIIHNHIKDCLKRAIEVYLGDGYYIQDNYFDFINYTGIYFRGQESVITGNYLISNDASEAGIYIHDTNRTVLGYNNMIGFSGYGIYATACYGLKIFDNELSDCVDNGLYLSTSDLCTITGNRINADGDYGIRLAASTCDKNIVVANFATGGTAGISDAGTGTVVANNITA